MPSNRWSMPTGEARRHPTVAAEEHAADGAIEDCPGLRVRVGVKQNEYFIRNVNALAFEPVNPTAADRHILAFREAYRNRDGNTGGGVNDAMFALALAAFVKFASAYRRQRISALHVVGTVPSGSEASLSVILPRLRVSGCCCG